MDEIKKQLDTSYSLATDQRDYVTALSLCETIIQAHPKLIAALFRTRAYIYAHKADFKQAIDGMTSVIQRGPAEPRDFFQRNCGTWRSDTSSVSTNLRPLKELNGYDPTTNWALRTLGGGMIMSEVDDLFNDAYKLDVLEEKPREAIELCRRALEIEPDNYRVRVFLAMLLGDHGNAEEVSSRQHFVNAIKKAEKASLFCATWPEEAAIHHLGIWELRQNHHYAACLYFLIDYLACANESSYGYLMEVLAGVEPRLAEDIKMILARLKDEYSCVPLGKRVADLAAAARRKDTSTTARPKFPPTQLTLMSAFGRSS